MNADGTMTEEEFRESMDAFYVNFMREARRAEYVLDRCCLVDRKPEPQPEGE